MCAAPSLQAGAAGLTARAEAKGAAALAAAGQSWARLQIDADGTARLVGLPPQPEAAAEALAAVRTALAAETGFPGVIARFAPHIAAESAAPVGAAPAPATPVPDTAPPAPGAPAPVPPKLAPPAFTSVAPDPRLVRASPRACQTALALALRGNPIRFASGRAEVAGVGRENFASLAAAAKACDRHRLQIAGHTDLRGAASFNRRLSLARARAVRALLIDAGAAAGALQAIGFGESRPLDRRRTQAAFAANRRIEIIVTPR
jgi:outer membrane protein OmpA-like peptidoglycan-associated protein